MPRYFFNRVGGLPDEDGEGVDLPGLDEAKYEAIAFASDTLKDKRFALWNGGEVRIEATDENRILLFTVFLKTEIATPST